MEQQDVAPEVEQKQESLFREPTPEERKVSPRKGSEIVVSEQGFLQAKDLEGRFRIANAFFRAGMVPKSYKSAEAVMTGMEFALELGLRPLTGLRNIAVINGSPSIWGELPLALCQNTGKLKRISERLYDKEYNEVCFSNKNLHVKPWIAVVDLEREGYEPVQRWFSTDDAKVARLLDKDGPWHTYHGIMLKRRARSIALKDVFADALQGLSIAELDHNLLPDGPVNLKDVTPQGKVARSAADILDAAMDRAEAADL